MKATEPTGPRQCAEGFTHHDWHVQYPHQPPPQTLVCLQCGKHVPAVPSDTDYDQYRPLETR